MAFRSFLIKNGRLWTGTEFRTGNVLIQKDTVVSLDAPDDTVAEYVYDAAGRIVSTGLLDIHTHLYNVSTPIFGFPTELVCAPFGVTATVDGGAELSDKAYLDTMMVKARVFAITDIKEEGMDFTRTEKMLAAYGDAAIGIKMYYDARGNKFTTLKHLEEVCAFARARGVKVMVHCNHSPTAMLDIIKTLSAGDILTHIYHGDENPITADEYAAYKLAKEKGVILDTGNAGRVHTNFSVLRDAISKGYLPDTISSDLTCGSAFNRGGRYGLTLCMSMHRTAGMTEEQILRAVTSDAAKAVGMDAECGVLEVGRKADIAVLGYENDPYRFEDTDGNVLEDENGYVCHLTVSKGQILYRR